MNAKEKQIVIKRVNNAYEILQCYKKAFGDDDMMTLKALRAWSEVDSLARELKVQCY